MASGHEAAAEAAEAAAINRPAGQPSGAAEQWVLAAEAWCRASEALEKARQAEPEGFAVRDAEAAHLGAGALLRGGSTAAGGAGAVATFPLSVERKGRSTSLDVPFTFGAPLRHARLTEWLGKERWAVRGGAAPATASPGGATEAAVQAAELLFVRDVLGPLRLRPGAVPEKIVARLLAIGVMVLQKRCEQLASVLSFMHMHSGTVGASSGLQPAFTEQNRAEQSRAEQAVALRLPACLLSCFIMSHYWCEMNQEDACPRKRTDAHR
ncbi:hypothetical protein ABPG75_000387 [Micractinium tetrahymenae]